MAPHQQLISPASSRCKGVLDAGLLKRALLDMVMPLTRSQVARRLGRSISTVRALEAQGVLSPGRGPRGQRLFEVEEVDEVLAQAAVTGRTLPWLEALYANDSPEPAAQMRQDLIAARCQIAALEGNGEALRAELESVRAQVLEVVEVLLNTTPRRASVLAALERLLSIVR
jgi:DNA-binding transcriptional MerR regulator